jgi:hypothetical protein
MTFDQYIKNMEMGLVRWSTPLAFALLIPVFKPILKEATGVRKMAGLVFDNMASSLGNVSDVL